MRRGAGGWEGATLILELHRAVSPTCTGGAHTIVVDMRSSVAELEGVFGTRELKR